MKCQKLGKESHCSEGFSSCSWNGNRAAVVRGGWLKGYVLCWLGEGFIALQITKFIYNYPYLRERSGTSQKVSTV